MTTPVVSSGTAVLVSTRSTPGEAAAHLWLNTPSHRAMATAARTATARVSVPPRLNGNRFITLTSYHYKDQKEKLSMR
jgi:hypothetical protein